MSQIRLKLAVTYDLSQIFFILPRPISERIIEISQVLIFNLDFNAKQKESLYFSSNQHFINIIEVMINRSVQRTNQAKILTEATKKQSDWQKIINGIVRPPRSNYKQSALGSRTFILNETRYQRKEVEIIHEGKRLMLMTFQPEIKRNWLILYLHGNSSSKIQATSILKFLPFRFSLASFDFIGCGRNSEADTVSLGVREAKQVQTVVQHLVLNKWKVVLWGRSMGAATALKFGKAPIIVADSSFHSFRSLCKQKAQQNAPKLIPTCFVSCVFPCIYEKLRLDVKERAKYDIQELEIANDVSKINKQTMIIFLNGDQDLLIDKSNSQKLYNSFKGAKKHLQIFNGSHNSKRPEDTIRKIMRYIAQFVDEQPQSINKDEINENQIRIK